MKSTVRLTVWDGAERAQSFLLFGQTTRGGEGRGGVRICEVEPCHWEALLPPGSNSNHASSFVEQAGEGTMVMTWFGGGSEGKQSGVSIYISCLAHGVAGNCTTAQWTSEPPIMVSLRDGYANQVLHRSASITFYPGFGMCSMYCHHPCAQAERSPRRCRTPLSPSRRTQRVRNRDPRGYQADIRRPCIHWLHVWQQARGATARSPVKSYAASAKSLAPPDAQQMLCM